MANTTISISKEFQNWLKDKGRKGESYENIIRSFLRAEALKDINSFKELPVVKTTTTDTDAAKKQETNEADEESDIGKIF